MINGTQVRKFAEQDYNNIGVNGANKYRTSIVLLVGLVYWNCGKLFV